MTTTSAISCLPRFTTRRRPDRPTLGPAVGKVAALLGRPFMPWQQRFANVAYELDPATGRLVYRYVRLTVPRQSGKTTLEMAGFTHRGLATRQFGSRQRMVYTAQKRKDAWHKWLQDFLPDYEASRGLRGKWSARYARGEEGFDYANGSTWHLEAGTESTGHGDVLDMGFIDEAFAQKDGRLEQAFRPAMLTRAQPQLWTVSTMGWEDEMAYLWPLVEDGRQRCLDGATDTVCYIEYSAPDDADPADPAVWWATMPALGHTQTEATIRAEYDSAATEADFCRAYLNQVRPKPLASMELVLPGWAGLFDPRSTVEGEPVFGLDATPERSWGSFGVAGYRPDGDVHVELIDHRPGLDWMVERAAQVTHDHGGRVAVDPASACGSLIRDLEEAGVRVDVLNVREVAQACGALYDRAVAGTLKHRADPDLDAAVAGARRRDVGDAWKWNRRIPSVDISPLYAVTLALASLPAAYDVLASVY